MNLDKWNRINNKNRLEIVENLLVGLEDKNKHNKGLNEEEQHKYNKLCEEHKELVDSLGYSTMRVKLEI